MSSAQSPKRYPKRKRVQVSYTETIDSEELGEDVNTVPLIKDDPDNDIDWKTAAKKVTQASLPRDPRMGCFMKLTIVVHRPASPRLARRSTAKPRRRASSPSCEWPAARFSFLRPKPDQVWPATS